MPNFMFVYRTSTRTETFPKFSKYWTSDEFAEGLGAFAAWGGAGNALGWDLDRPKFVTTFDERLSGPWEQMPARWSKRFGGIEIHEVGDVEHIVADPNQIERVLLAFAAATTSRRRRSALHDDDAPIPHIAGIEI